MILLPSLIAIAAILAQGFVVLAFLKFVKSFGKYTESQTQLTAAILTVHKSNLMLHRFNMLILEELRKLQPTQGKVA